MGKEIGRSFKYNRSKIFNQTLKKPVLSSLADHTSYTSNLTQTIISSQLENEDSTKIQKMTDISNTYDINSCLTSRKQNISVQATATPPWLAPLINNLPIAPFESPKTTGLTAVDKEYLYFQVNSKYSHAAQCVKSRILNKAIYSILYIDTFEQQCVVIKCMLQSSRLEDHMKNIDIVQSSFTRSSFEHKISTCR